MVLRFVNCPPGALITSENYSEFLTAFAVFANTNKFQEELLAKVNETKSESAILLLEGKTDASLISSAWEKLNPNTPIPFTPVPLRR